LGLIGLGKIKNDCKISLLASARIIKVLNSPASFISKIGAASALALLGMKSNDENITEALIPPQSVFMLNRMTPEYLLIRTISRYLCCWDTISPSKNWILSQIPDYIKNALRGIEKINYTNQHIISCYYSIVAGCCFAIGLKYAGSFNQLAFDTIAIQLNEFSKSLSNNSITSLSATYAQRIFLAIMKSLCPTLCSALAFIMAGSGNLKTFEILKNVYSSIKEPNYGTHMAMNMCFGLLFLKDGTATVGSADICIASLFISFFPLFPKKVGENRCHLQALRYMWTLAVERRCLVTQDVNDKEIVCAPIEIIFKEKSANRMNNSLRVYSPCILPPFEQIQKLRVCGPRYWTLSIPVAKLMDSNGEPFKLIHVQRKTQYLPYVQVTIN
jgi:anaphase-promoting complex subunit 1